mgnify:CR=1 FL=1
MAKKGGLGRGLDILFQDTGAGGGDEGVSTLRLAEIEPDKNQPRKAFDDTALSELAASITEHGVLQPIVVRPSPAGGYIIVAGERRWRAARLAGLTEIPALIKDISDTQAMEIALIENLQREDLDPVEEALGYRQLMERCSYTQEAAAARLSKSRSAQQQAADIIVKEGLNVRQAEALCKKMAKKPRPKRELTLPPLPCEVELSLKEALGTEVHVQYKEGKGSLNVSFYSDEQLRAFANLLGKYEKERNL